jgi:hypothetical protein
VNAVRAWTGALAAALLMSACASARSDKPSLSAPAPDYAQTVRARLALASSQRDFTVRFNPAACGCPPFEVRLADVWQRVAFDVSSEDDPVLVALRDATASSARREPGQTWDVQGRLDSSLITCGRGALVVTLRPTALGAPEDPDEPSP